MKRAPADPQATTAGGRLLARAAEMLWQQRAKSSIRELDSHVRSALLMRALLDELSRLPGAPAVSDRDNLWQVAEQGHCPLLADLDAERREQLHGDVQLLAELSDLPAADELFQQLAGLRLSRGRGRQAAPRVGTGRERNRAGQFFTPAWMARDMAAWLLGAGEQPEAVLDPACGSGRLLEAVVAQTLVEGDGGDRAASWRRWIAERLHGVEVDSSAAALARCRFWLLADPLRGPVAGLERCIRVGDAIAAPLRGSRAAFAWHKQFGTFLEQGGFPCIITNPPFEVLRGYARRRGLARYAERIRRSGYELALQGNLNTWRLFLERCLQLLCPGGRLAIVLPLGFCTDRTAAALRRALLEPGWLRSLNVFAESDRAFTGVGQAVVWIGVVRRKSRQPVTVTRSGKVFQLEPGWIQAIDCRELAIPLADAQELALAERLQRASPERFERVALGRVGEVDQTNFRSCLRSRPGQALLVRGEHMAPYRVDLDTGNRHERWLDAAAYAKAKGDGAWQQHLQRERLAQTGIVNMEAGRRLVAARVPAGVYLGNSVNYWLPKDLDDWPGELALGYLLGLLNSTPYEWRFRLTSSNNNVNLYEIKSLPIPRLGSEFPAAMRPGFLERSAELLRTSNSSVLGTVRQITAGWGAPARHDRVAAMVIGQAALLREQEQERRRAAWLEAVIDHLVNWHLGLDEPDLDLMLRRLPARNREDK